MVRLAANEAGRKIETGSWERAMLRAHAADDAFCINWTLALDEPLDPAMVVDALAALVPAFPRYFARAERLDNSWTLLDGLTAEAVVCHHNRCEGGARGVAGQLARTRLDPERDGLFRCYLIGGPDPVLAFQATHVVGDGHTNHTFRTAFAAALNALASGKRAEPPRTVATAPIGLDEVAAILVPDPRAFATELRHMFCPVPPQLPAAAAPSEIRIFRSVVPLERFAPVMKRAIALAVSPLSLLLAALSAAVREAIPPLDGERGEFLLPQVPRDLRAALGRPAETGNLIYAQGVPVLASDPSDTDTLARAMHDRLQRGRSNRLMYRHFLHELITAEERPATVPETLHPFPVFGATEIPNRGAVERLGHARVLETVFQTPILTRRFADGRVHLGCAVRCSPAAEPALRRLLDGVLRRLFGDIPDWELL